MANDPVLTPSAGCGLHEPSFGLGLYQGHCHSSHAADDGGVDRISDMLRALLGLLAGDQDQLAIVHFTPTADVSFAQFNEEDRPVEVAVPGYGRNFFLAGIDLHDGTVIYGWGTIDWHVAS